MLLNFLSIIVLYFVIIGVNAFDQEFTVNVDAGRETCFYQPVDNAGVTIDVEYQVIDGGHGDFDINFQMAEPNGRIMVADFKKSDNIHRVTANVKGEYKFCFDNTISRMNSKTVFFEIIIDSSLENSNEEWEDNDSAFADDYEFEGKIDNLNSSLNAIRKHLTKVGHLQDQIRMHEARDRNIAEENFWRVNTWSLLQIVVMVVVGLVQIVVVKSLFDDQSILHKTLTRSNLPKVW